MEPDRSGSAGSGDSVFLPVEWQARGRAEETRIAIEAWLEVLLAFSAPVSLSFVLCAGRAEGARGGLVVHGVNKVAAMEAAWLFKSAADALNAWQGLGDPVPYRPPEPGPNVFDLAAVDGAGRKIFSHRSAPWDLAAGEEPTVLTIELRGNNTASGRPAAVRCSVSLSGHGPAAEMIATLLAADPPGEVRLEAAPRARPGAQPPELVLPLSMAAHLVSSPARMPDAWPAHPVGRSELLLELVERAVPPHAAVFGGSGLGKSTLMENLITASFAAGNTVAVICPHGDLAARAATLAHARDLSFGAINFADDDSVARWNLCIPPPGVAPTQWAAELVHIIRGAWPDMPEAYFGPVWDKSTRVALSVLTRDPQGPHPLSELTSVMLPPLHPRWQEALRRIGDDQLTREVTELHGAIRKNSEGHYGIWATSKMEAFTADDRMRRIIEHRTSTIDLDGVTRGKSLIVSAPAAALGDAGASVMVSAMLTQLWHRIRRRQDRSQVIDVYIDECHRIPHNIIDELLAESRKYGVRLRLATQSPHQLDPSTRDAILTNTGAVGTFRTGPNEAALLGPTFPTIPAGTFTRLDRHWLAITDGEQELVGPAPPPMVDPDDRSALEIAHQQQHAPTSADGFMPLSTATDAAEADQHCPHTASHQ